MFIKIFIRWKIYPNYFEGSFWQLTAVTVKKNVCNHFHIFCLNQTRNYYVTVTKYLVATGPDNNLYFMKLHQDRVINYWKRIDNIVKKAVKLGKLALPIVSFKFSKKCINPIQDEHSWDCSQMEGAKRFPPLFLKSVAHVLQWWNLAQQCLT